MVSRPARLLVVPLALAAMLAPFVPAFAQVAPPSRTFDAVTSAYGFDMTIANPSIPAGITIQGSGPVAQSRLTSLGQSDSFAAFPYPGDTVANISGVASSALLGNLPVPSYPLITSSNAASGGSAVNYPGVTLRTDTNGSRSQAEADIGEDALGFTADSKVVVNDDGTVTATARTEMSALELGGVLTIDGIESTATATLESDGSITRSWGLSAGAIRIPGLNLSIPPTTPSQAAIPIPIPGVDQLPVIPLPPIPLPLGGTTIATPVIGFIDGSFFVELPGFGNQKVALPAEPLIEALEGVGITVGFEAPIDTATGIVAPVLSFETVLPAPPPNAGFNGETPVKLSLGRTSASFQSTVAGEPVSAIDVPVLGGDAIPVGSPGSLDLPLPAPAGLDLPAAPTPTPSSGNGQGNLVPVVSLSPRASIFDIYLVLVGIGLAGTLASQVIRYVGVRSTWTS